MNEKKTYMEFTMIESVEKLSLNEKLVIAVFCAWLISSLIYLCVCVCVRGCVGYELFCRALCL